MATATFSIRPARLNQRPYWSLTISTGMHSLLDAVYQSPMQIDTILQAHASLLLSANFITDLRTLVASLFGSQQLQTFHNLSSQYPRATTEAFNFQRPPSNNNDLTYTFLLAIIIGRSLIKLAQPSPSHPDSDIIFNNVRYLSFELRALCGQYFLVAVQSRANPCQKLVDEVMLPILSAFYRNSQHYRSLDWAGQIFASIFYLTCSRQMFREAQRHVSLATANLLPTMGNIPNFSLATSVEIICTLIMHERYRRVRLFEMHLPVANVNASIRFLLVARNAPGNQELDVLGLFGVLLTSIPAFLPFI